MGVSLAVLAGIVGGSVFAYEEVRYQANQFEAQLVAHLELGENDLVAAKVSLRQANANLDVKLIDQAKVQFIAAQLQFSTASQITDTSDLLHRLENLPVVGQTAQSRHTAVDYVCQMGVQLALAGQGLADLDGLLIKPSGGAQQSRNFVTVMDQVQSKIGPIRTELASALKAANHVEVGVLPSSQQATFISARATIAKALDAINQFESLEPTLFEILGGNGARTYLVEQVNPAELRSGGGFIGTYSVLRVDHGTLSLIKSGDAGLLSIPRATVGQKGYVTPPGPFRESLLQNFSWSFDDSNFAADFPTNAQVGETFVQPRLGLHIDGVISIDYYMVARMLGLTGPIAVPGYSITLTADNLVQLLIQYDLAAFTDPHADVIHKAILSAVSGPLLQRIATLQPGLWPALITALNDLASSRHLQAYFNNADAQKTVDQFGWSGVLKTSPSLDYMMEVENNMGSTKANYFVTRHYTVALTRTGATLHHQVTVEIYDNMPYSYRPNEYYHAYLMLFVSDKAAALSNNMVRSRYVSPPPPAGTHMLGGWLNIHGYGHDYVAVITWDTPWQPNGRGQEQIYWQKQPGTSNDKIDVVWNDGNGHTYKTTGDLAQDRVITLAPSAVTLVQGQIGSAQLPSLTLG